MAKLAMHEEYAFCAAHRITVFPRDSRDADLHGHTWKVAIDVEVDAGPDGYTFDRAMLDDVADLILGPIDHSVINDIEGLARGLNEDLAYQLGVRFEVAVSRLPGRPMLRRLVLTQLSSGQTHRPVEHVTIWEPGG